MEKTTQQNAEQEKAQLELHKNICLKIDKVMAWFKKRTSQLEYPIYSSYDIRDAG